MMLRYQHVWPVAWEIFTVAFGTSRTGEGSRSRKIPSTVYMSQMPASILYADAVISIVHWYTRIFLNFHVNVQVAATFCPARHWHPLQLCKVDVQQYITNQPGERQCCGMQDYGLSRDSALSESAAPSRALVREPHQNPQPTSRCTNGPIQLA